MILCAAIVALSFLIPTLAVMAMAQAADVAPIVPPSVWADILTSLLPYVILPVGGILSAVLIWLGKLLATKLGIQISAEQEAAMRRAIRAAVAGAEELAAAKLKAGALKPVGADKLQMVVDAVTAKYPKVLPDELRQLIHEELGAISGAGATGESKVG